MLAVKMINIGDRLFIECVGKFISPSSSSSPSSSPSSLSKQRAKNCFESPHSVGLVELLHAFHRRGGSPFGMSAVIEGKPSRLKHLKDYRLFTWFIFIFPALSHTLDGSDNEEDFTKVVPLHHRLKSTNRSGWSAFKWDGANSACKIQQDSLRLPSYRQK